jgi:hypothetical protein
VTQPFTLNTWIDPSLSLASHLLRFPVPGVYQVSQRDAEHWWTALFAVPAADNAQVTAQAVIVD